MSFLETDKDYSKKLPGKKSRKELEDKAIRKVNSLIETKGQVKARINGYIMKIVGSEEDYYNQKE